MTIFILFISLLIVFIIFCIVSEVKGIIYRNKLNMPKGIVSSYNDAEKDSKKNDGIS